jgi:hypothetical protein
MASALGWLPDLLQYQDEMAEASRALLLEAAAHSKQ